MKNNSRIINCEMEYYKCFALSRINRDIIHCYDDKLKDMYYHNFTYISNIVPITNLEEIIKDEISKKKAQESDFCNILIDVDYRLLPTMIFDNPVSVTINGFYSFDLSNISILKTVDSVSMEQVTDKKRLEDVLYCDMQNDEIAVGKDFCTRRCYRRGEVYLSEKGVNSYVFYDKGTVIGVCDLFIHDKVAKIEDFAVIEQYQRKGFDTVIT